MTEPEHAPGSRHWSPWVALVAALVVVGCTSGSASSSGTSPLGQFRYHFGQFHGQRGPDPEGGLVIGRSYEIRVVGSLGPAAREAFTDVAVEVEPTATVLCGDLDQADLHALLDRVRAFGLELMDIRQVPDQLSG